MIEAVFEEMGVKKQVFGALDRIAKPGAMLATNTSTSTSTRSPRRPAGPSDVLGMHFFSPANVMRLLEIVRGAKTAPDVLATAMSSAKQLGKVRVRRRRLPRLRRQPHAAPRRREARARAARRAPCRSRSTRR